MRAVAKGRPRTDRRGWVYTPANTRKAESELRRRLKECMHGRQLFEGPLAVTIALVFKRPKTSKRKYPSVRPDLDNLAKLTTDSANGIVYRDDAQICQLYLQKSYGQEDKIVFHVLEIG